ncbi:hypothetical protein [Planococcus sp. CAU13]|uniref:hypothetical protein n=1 Tax=Planococcus sp. CAU13 TaxID=1541197 RepID=UPI00053000AA|nr:hypothetical protein [Planococcus sp. CAU13]
MNGIYVRAAYAISIIALIIGLLMIFNSSSRGQSLASAESLRNGGMMDTNQYNLIYEAGINQFLILGGIFTGSGLLIAILVSFTLLIKSKPFAEEEIRA